MALSNASRDEKLSISDLFIWLDKTLSVLSKGRSLVQLIMVKVNDNENNSLFKFKVILCTF